MPIYGTIHLKRNENLMSASDDYDRHRLRTDTKYLKVSVKPFQRLAECEAEPHKKHGGVRGGSPERTAPPIITLIVTHSPSVTFGDSSLPE